MHSWSTLATLEKRIKIGGTLPTVEDCDHLQARCDHSVINVKRMAARNLAMVAKMYLVITSRAPQQINVLKDPFIKIITDTLALPVVESHALGNIQVCFIANFDVHR